MPHRAAASFATLGPWPQEGGVVLACSGGADSTFMALAWQEFARGLGPLAPAAEVWVVDHGHRSGTEREAQRAQRLYQEMGFAVRILRGETPGSTDENSLRRYRYGLIEQAIAAAAQGAQTGGSADQKVFALLTAHHADDQAETVLLRILRGTGLRGLAGIPARRPLNAGALPGVELRRPLLELRAEHIRQRLQEIDQAWIEDPSNNDPSAAARNRIRQELMPLLGQIATGDPTKALLRLSSEAAEWRSWLEQGLSEKGQDWASDWKSLPAVIRRESIAQILRQEGHTVSPTRLMNLENALLERGSAGIDAAQRLSIAGGSLRCRPR